MSMQPGPTPPDADGRDLAAFGYRQELVRSLGSFSSFAAGFSYLSILTGMFQLFAFGFGAGGPAFFWTWPLVFGGQFLVALCFAEMAAHYPLSGSVYQWARRIGSRNLGWIAGWIYMACLIVTMAAVVLALQGILPQIWPGFQVIGTIDDPVSAARNAVLLGVILTVASTAINVVGVKLLAAINNVGVFTELLGVVFLIGILFTHTVRGPEVVFQTMGHGALLPGGYMTAFLAAALMASYVMYGFDTAGSLAEETTNPRQTVPHAILRALGAAGGFGTLILLGALMAAPDLADPQLGLTSGGLPLIVKDVLVGVPGRAFLCVAAFAIVVCALAVHTGAIRLMFAMARDGLLPFSDVLAKVSPQTGTPVVPAIVVGALTCAILLVNMDFPQIMPLVSSIAIVWANVTYLFVTVPLLQRRMNGWPGAEAFAPGEGFSLGRWGLPVNLAAVAFGAFMVVNVAWPRPEIYGAAPHMRYAAIWLTIVVVGLAVAHAQFAKVRVPDADQPAGDAA